MAAGKSTRTYPLTLNKPKPLLKVRNRTLLELNLDQLNSLVDEVIIIIGYKGQMIKDYIGSEYKQLKITYFEQKEQLGTGNAVLQIEPFIEDKFIVMNGDDFYHEEDIKECLSHEYTVLSKPVSNPERFGIFKVDYNNNIKDIIEKPKEFISNLANCGLYLFDKDIFPILKRIKKSERNEYEVTDALKEFIKEKQVYCVKSKYWIAVSNAWNLLELNERFLSLIRENIKGVVEEGALVENSIVEEGSVISKNSKIYNSVIGRNCDINAEITSSSVGNNCRLSGKIDNSIIYDDSEVLESSISYSVIDSSKLNNVTILSSDNKGAVIASNCNILNTTVNPGIRIWPNNNIKNKELKEDVLDGA